MFLLGGVVDARLAVGGHLVDFSLRPRAGVERLRGRIEGEAPNVGIEIFGEYLGLAVGAEANDLSVGTGAGKHGPVRGDRQTENLALGAADINRLRGAIGRHLEDLT